jgi:hypothetical protein
MRGRTRTEASREMAVVERWRRLWTLARDAAKKAGDARLLLLERYVNEPETVLRRMSVVTEADIAREFPA